MAWLRETCGSCVHCRRGQENLCEGARFTGYHEHGGYADFALVQADFAYPIPARFSDVEAAPLLCAGIIGYRALKRCDPPPGATLALYGFGSSAHVVRQRVRLAVGFVKNAHTMPSLASLAVSDLDATGLQVDG